MRGQHVSPSSSFILAISSGFKNENFFSGNKKGKFWGRVTSKKRWAFPGLFFLHFRLFNYQLPVQYKLVGKLCRCWDSNRGSLVSEATAFLPTKTPFLSYFDIKQVCSQKRKYSRAKVNYSRRLLSENKLGP